MTKYTLWIGALVAIVVSIALAAILHIPGWNVEGGGMFNGVDQIALFTGFTAIGLMVVSVIGLILSVINHKQMRDSRSKSYVVFTVSAIVLSLPAAVLITIVGYMVLLILSFFIQLTGLGRFFWGT